MVSKIFQSNKHTPLSSPPQKKEENNKNIPPGKNPENGKHMYPVQSLESLEYTYVCLFDVLISGQSFDKTDIFIKNRFDISIAFKQK